MIRSLFISVGSGYALKIIQTVISLLLLPYIISKDGIGLSGFGMIGVILSIPLFASLLLDGWRLTVSKRAGEAYKCKKNILLIQFFLTFCYVSIISIFFLVFNKPLLELIEVDVSVVLVYAIVIFICTENLAYTLESYFHTIQKTWIVNSIYSFEVIVRAIVIVFIFESMSASVEYYILTWVLFSLVRMLILAIVSSRFLLEGVKHFTNKNILNEMGNARGSLLLSLKALSSFLIYRATIILANKYIGAEAAGIASLILTTIRSYIVQALISVIRPMIIPLTSGLALTALNETKRELVNSIHYLYQFFSFISLLVLAQTTSIWLAIWLNTDMIEYIFIVKLSIIIMAIEVMTNICNSLLISQGEGVNVSLGAIFHSVIYSIVIVLILNSSLPINIEILITAVMLISLSYNAIFIPLLFNRTYKDFGTNFRFGHILLMLSVIPVMFYVDEFNIYIQLVLILLLASMSYSLFIKNLFGLALQTLMILKDQRERG